MILVFVISMWLGIICLTLGVDIGCQVLAERRAAKPPREKKARIRSYLAPIKAMVQKVDRYQKTVQHEFQVVFVIDKSPKQPHRRHAKA